MTTFSETPAAIDWLKQFCASDEADAAALIDAMTLVSHEIFFDRLRALIIESAQNVPGRVGLYAEREVRKWKGVPNRLFKERIPTR